MREFFFFPENRVCYHKDLTLHGSGQSPHLHHNDLRSVTQSQLCGQSCSTFTEAVEICKGMVPTPTSTCWIVQEDVRLGGTGELNSQVYNCFQLFNVLCHISKWLLAG